MYKYQLWWDGYLQWTKQFDTVEDAKKEAITQYER